MNVAEGHVMMFARWLDGARTRALFYESNPFCKTRAIERDIASMLGDGYVPLRYRGITD